MNYRSLTGRRKYKLQTKFGVSLQK